MEIVFLDAVIWALWVDSEDLLAWIFELVDMKNMHQLLKQHVGEILRYAAFKPNLIIKCFRKLKDWSLLADGFNQRIDFLGEKAGLLPILCYANADIAEDIISQHFLEIPEALILDKLLGRNALEHVIDHGNCKSVDILMSKQAIMKVFLGADADGVEEYARKKDQIKIAQKLEQFMKRYTLCTGF